MGYGCPRGRHATLGRAGLLVLLAALALVLASGSPAAAAAATLEPGLASPAPSAQDLSATLTQMTGLSPSQVSASDVCAAASSGQAQCAAQAVVLRSTGARVRPHTGARATFTQVFPRSSRAISPATSPAAAKGPPQAGTPAYLQQAYDLAYLSQTAGASDTVAIVDAFDDPGAEADLANYRSSFGLPPCTTPNGCFRKLNENGQSSPLPSPNSGWESEISLDLDAVSALCPNCHIVLIETNTNSYGDMYAGIAEARALGANQISNSWSGGPYGSGSFPGSTVIAATGDNGYLGPGADGYPAAYPGVTAAGGTSLAAAGDGSTARGFSESAWSGAGSGCDTSEPKPSYQSDTGCTARSYADLSADADPNTGLITYDSGNGGWFLIGGTSLATPLVAAYEALTGVNGSTPQWAYADSAFLNDPITGSNGSCAQSIVYICNARAGYDGPTGAGSISGDVVPGGPGIGASTAKNIAASTATLAGGVYPNRLDTTYYWQYGASTSYGSQTAAVDIGAGSAPVSAGAALTGLTPSTTFHYRLVAQNSAGTAYGYDYTFTTAGPGAVPPANTAPPAISGTPQQGQSLSVSTGTWNPAPTSYSYRWQRSSDGGSTWATISAATAASYTPVAADVGAALRAVVTATDNYGSASAPAAQVGPIASGAPSNTGAPTISGSAVQGNVLTVSSSWNPAGTAYAYQWQHSTDGGATWSNVGGATSTSYALSVADEGSYIRAMVTATNPYGRASATSPSIGPVVSNPPVNTAAPTLTGTTQRTYTLSATQGTWSGTGNTYAYQWQHSPDGTTWTNIGGATATSYALGTADEADFIRVLVTASNVDGIATKVSNSTFPISPYPPANTAAPVVRGTPERSFTLTASQGTWTGPDNTYTYQWQEDSGEGFADIAGATGDTYTLGRADEGAVVRVIVTASNPDGVIMQASQPTATVQAAVPANQTPPTVAGTPERSYSLQASIGTWGGIGNSYAYQWQRSVDGAAWSDIAGATATTYTLGLTDEGDHVRVLVTASNPDGVAAVASTPTSAVLGAPPVSTSPPVMSGSAQRGSGLTGSLGSWAGIGNSYAYQWQRSADSSTWSNIAGATGASYTLTIGDEGSYIRLAVTASNPDGSVTVDSSSSNVVQAATPVNTAPPTLTGAAQRASTLYGTGGSWSGLGNTYVYQWQRSADGRTWTTISGATGSSYVVTLADEGAQLRMLVTASNPDGSVSAATAASSVVPASRPVNTSSPIITGSAQRASTLSATQGTWSGIGNSYTYQWQRSVDFSTWTNVAGATGTTYTLGVADENQSVRVLVTASNADGSASAASGMTAPIPSSPPFDMSFPVISGLSQRGATLASTLGTWSGIGNTYVMQWQRSSDGRTWTNITGATGATYTLAVGDEGDEVRLSVSASNPDGSATGASNVSAAVASTPPGNSSAPTIAGAAQRGSTLSVAPGTWNGIGNAYTYQWQHNVGSGFTNIAGATGTTYALGVADEGSSVRVIVTATNPDGTIGVASAWTATIPSEPPVVMSAPIISGVAQRGATLTSTQGTWNGLANSYASQWQRSTDGRTWTNITGATGTTYTLGVADEGDQVRVLITAANADGSASAASGATATIPSAPPVNTSAPAISGTAQRGLTLTSTQGSWSGIGNTYADQWQRSADGSTWSNIAGATAPSYALTTADEGNYVRLLITASNPDGRVTAASAATSTAVMAAPPVNTSAPAINGGAVRGSVLSVTSQGTWNGLGNGYAEQWQRSVDGGGSWSDVSGATGSTYTLGVTDEDAQFRVLVTASNADGSAAAASAATETVQSAPPVNTAPPSIMGAAQRTATLTLTQGSWNGAGNTYAYEWQRSTDFGASWSTISGATGTAYALTAADENANVRAVVIASNPDGTVRIPSPATPAVQPAPPVSSPSAPPTISGSARLGATLAAGPGAWTPSGAGFAYQWQRSSSVSGYQNISGANSSTYTLQPADVGHTVQVVVTATNVDGSVSATSAPSAQVLQPPVNRVVPAAPSGTLMDTYVLSADSGTWDTNGATFSYSWLRCAPDATRVDASCAAVGSAAAYTLSSADVGHTIAVAVSATSVGGTSAPVNSALTGAVAGRPLTNTAPPSISGNPQVPNTLTANAGTWSVPLTGIGYVWERCDADGVSSCAQVGVGASYTLSAADNGHTILLVANAASPGRAATAQSRALTVQAQPLPQNQVPPSISGSTARGGTLNASPGSWANNPTYAYQWERCTSTGQACQDIAGATSGSYLLGQSDEGFTIAVRVTARNTAGSASASSQPTSPIGSLRPYATHLPVITGAIAQQSVQLGVTQTAWQATPDTIYTTAWQRCAADGSGCQTIPGATSSLYRPVAADVGHRLVVMVTATNSDGSTPASSAPTAVVLPAAPRWRALPIVSAAKAAVGTALSITRGAWSGPSLDSDTLEVMRCTNVCVVVGSAGSYTISSADVGAVLRLRETAANAGGTTVVWSAQYVGPVTSASAAAADVGQGQALLRNAKGAVLAIADVAGRPAAAAGDTSGGHLVFGRMLVRSRVVRITRARGVHGKLKAWVCPVAGRRGAAPPACTAKVSLQARASVKLPRWMLTGRVRVVVVRQG